MKGFWFADTAFKEIRKYLYAHAYVDIDKTINQAGVSDKGKIKFVVEGTLQPAVTIPESKLPPAVRNAIKNKGKTGCSGNLSEAAANIKESQKLLKEKQKEEEKGKRKERIDKLLKQANEFFEKSIAKSTRPLEQITVSSGNSQRNFCVTVSLRMPLEEAAAQSQEVYFFDEMVTCPGIEDIHEPYPIERFLSEVISGVNASEMGKRILAKSREFVCQDLHRGFPSKIGDISLSFVSKPENYCAVFRFPDSYEYHTTPVVHYRTETETVYDAYSFPINGKALSFEFPLCRKCLVTPKEIEKRIIDKINALKPIRVDSPPNDVSIYAAELREKYGHTEDIFCVGKPGGISLHKFPVEYHRYAQNFGSGIYQIRCGLFTADYDYKNNVCEHEHPEGWAKEIESVYSDDELTAAIKWADGKLEDTFRRYGKYTFLDGNGLIYGSLTIRIRMYGKNYDFRILTSPIAEEPVKARNIRSWKAKITSQLKKADESLAAASEKEERKQAPTAASFFAMDVIRLLERNKYITEKTLVYILRGFHLKNQAEREYKIKDSERCYGPLSNVEVESRLSSLEWEDHVIETVMIHGVYNDYDSLTLSLAGQRIADHAEDILERFLPEGSDADYAEKLKAIEEKSERTIQDYAMVVRMLESRAFYCKKCEEIQKVLSGAPDEIKELLTMKLEDTDDSVLKEIYSEAMDAI